MWMHPLNLQSGSTFRIRGNISAGGRVQCLTHRGKSRRIDTQVSLNSSSVPAQVAPYGCACPADFADSSPVCIFAFGQSVLIRVDLPAPLGPVRTMVLPGISFTAPRSPMKLLMSGTVHPQASWVSAVPDLLFPSISRWRSRGCVQPAPAW